MTITTTSSTVVIDAEHPWPGLMPFTEGAHAWFHGREHEAAELQRLIRRETLTVLFGQSGLGKSSLLNAGLFPRLRTEDFLPVYIRLDIDVNSPPFRTQVLASIAAACEASGAEAPEAGSPGSLWQYFHRRDADFWSERNRLVTPVLVFDQFEEIFTLGRHEEQLEERCRALLGELADLIEDRMPAALAAAIEEGRERQADFAFSRKPCKVVFSFREDYLPDFEGMRTLIRPIMQNRMRLTRMGGAAALQAIRQPGTHLVSDEVAEQIVRFVAAPRAGRDYGELKLLEVEPALLSVVCRELNNQRIAAGRREISADLLLGGAQQRIIEDFYEGSLKDVHERLRWFIEDRLLTDAGYRDSSAIDDALRVPGVTREGIDLLIARRLLRLEERSGVLRVELTHDVLTQVAHQSREARKARMEAARQQQQEAARRRRMRRFAVASAFAVVAAVGLAVVFAVLFRRATEAQSLVMLARANSAFEQGLAGDPYAMLARAIELDSGNEAAIARAVALFAQRQQATLVGDFGRHENVRSLGHLRDDSWILAGGGRVQRLRPGARDGEVAFARVMRAEGDHADFGFTRLQWASDDAEGEQGLTFHPEARAITWVSPRRVLHVFNAETLGHVGDPVQLPDEPASIKVSADRQWVGALGKRAKLVVARLATGSGLVRPEGVETDVPVEGGRRQGSELAAVSVRGGAIVLHPGGATFYGWHGSATKRLLAWTNHAARSSVAQFSADGTWAAAAAGGMVKGVDMRVEPEQATVQFGCELPEGVSIRALDFSPDGKELAIGTLDKRVLLLRVEKGVNGVEPGALKHGGAVLAIRFNETNVLTTASADGAVRRWKLSQRANQAPDLEHARLLSEPIVHSEAVVDMAFGEHDLLTLARDGQQLSLWSLDPVGPGTRWSSWSYHQASPLTDEARAVLSGDEGQGLIAMDPARSASSPRRLVQPVAPLAELAMRLSPDGSTLALLDESGLRLVAADTGKLIARHALPPGDPHVAVAEFSPDGKRLATVTRDGTIRFWRTTGEPESFALALRSRPDALVFAPDGERVLAAAGQSTAWLDLRAQAVRPLTAAANAQALPRDVRWVGIATRPLRALILTASELRILPADGGVPRVVSLGTARAWTAAVSHDSTHVAIGGLDGRLRVLDLESGKYVGEVGQHDDAVTGVRFSADGLRVVSWSLDRTVRVWDSRSGLPFTDPIALTFTDPTIFGRQAPAVAFTPVGDRVAVLDGMYARLVDIGHRPKGAPPQWLPRLLQAAGASRLDESGSIQRIAREPALVQMQSELAGRDDEWAGWGREQLRRLRMAADQRKQEVKQ